MSKKHGDADPIMCVIELIHHGIRVGNELYDGTAELDKWVFQHDALSAWMKDAGSKAFLAVQGFTHRQIRSYGANKNNQYYRVI